MSNILDRLIPFQTVRCRHRTSDPWFDDDCRVAKRAVRLSERWARHADPCNASAATAAWYERRCQYRDLLRKKRENFWQSTVEADRSSPRQLWRSINQLMGRGHAPVSAAVRALELHQFFNKKVASVRASTADAPEPTFSTVPSGCSFCTDCR